MNQIVKIWLGVAIICIVGGIISGTLYFFIPQISVIPLFLYTFVGAGLCVGIVGTKYVSYIKNKIP